ncbi:diguanylate cyclase [Salinisphaera dokdonensis CL-ES53]|uniref:diguanylate cyclase n=2 Tax=Salinisphaera TaxID=180541 RepID=A0ABV2B425_9GAMM
MNQGTPEGDSDLSQRHRRELLRLLLWFTVLFSVGFIAINFSVGKYGLMAIEIAVAVFAVWLLTILPRTPNLRRWALVYMVTLLSGTMFAFASPATSITVFSWILVMPVLTHLLLGRWLGGVLSLFYLVLSASIFCWRFGTTQLMDTPGSIANIVTVTACAYLFSHVYEASRERAEQQLSVMALTDSLTGLANRTQLEQSFSRAVLQRQLPLSLVMIDLDYFKRINDEHGHATGDAVLRIIAQAMREHIRESDLACRLGGEEFCLLLPSTNPQRARRLADRLREDIETLECRHEDAVLKLTASIGVATASNPTDGLDPMLHVADQNLYRAKFAGRNCVVG